MKSVNLLTKFNCIAVEFMFTWSVVLFDVVMAQSVYFDDSDPGIMKLGNAMYYEVAFRKTNGSIACLKDKTTGYNISAGSRYEHLWGIKDMEADQFNFGGGDYDTSGENMFSYVWDDSNQTLDFYYTPDSTADQGLIAKVQIKATDNSYFDLQLTLTSEYGEPIQIISFPSNLIFLENDVEEAYLPIIPGVVLESSFFLQSRSYSYIYPGWPGVFADFVYQKLYNGGLALYSLG